jgi:hypothetical protein
MKFLHRYLDPSESLLELLFGLIMAFTFTAGARLLSAPGEISALALAGALTGCNVAWGIIDGAFYLLGSLFNRNRRRQFVRRLQAVGDEAEAIAVVRDEFDLEDEPRMREEDKLAFHRAVLEMLRHAGTERVHLRRSDFVAAALIAALVAATAIPALVPLLVLPDGQHALRVANIAQIVLLFAVGYGWARYAGTNRWRAGLLVTVLGVCLILIAVALGG